MSVLDKFLDAMKVNDDFDDDEFLDDDFNDDFDDENFDTFTCPLNVTSCTVVAAFYHCCHSGNY